MRWARQAQPPALAAVRVAKGCQTHHLALPLPANRNLSGEGHSALAAGRREANRSRANPKLKPETLFSAAWRCFVKPPALAEACAALHWRRRCAPAAFGACRAPRVAIQLAGAARRAVQGQTPSANLKPYLLSRSRDCWQLWPWLAPQGEPFKRANPKRKPEALSSVVKQTKAFTFAAYPQMLLGLMVL